MNAGRRHLDEVDVSCEKRHPARRPGLMRERGSETAARSWTALLRDNYIIGLGRLTVKSKQKPGGVKQGTGSSVGSGNRLLAAGIADRWENSYCAGGGIRTGCPMRLWSLPP